MWHSEKADSTPFKGCVFDYVSQNSRLDVFQSWKLDCPFVFILKWLEIIFARDYWLCPWVPSAFYSGLYLCQALPQEDGSSTPQAC